MQKTDLSKTLRHYYKARPTAELVTIAAANFITIAGHGEPAGPLFNARVKALFSVAYNIKKICKSQQQDFTVPKLEGLWWKEVEGEAWHWKLMVQLPEFVSIADFKQALALAAVKGDANLQYMQLEHFPDTMAAQILHTGPYTEEAPTLELLDAYITQHQLEKTGQHHEIYISDPRKTAPEKLKTILRYNVRHQ